MRFARVMAYVGIAVGILRLLEFYFFGDLHRGYALAWAAHALISSVLILWLVKREVKKEQTDSEA